MTREEHIARHVALHKALDELIADYISHELPSPGSDRPYKGLTNTTLLELMEWSHKQTLDPDEPRPPLAATHVFAKT